MAQAHGAPKNLFREVVPQIHQSDTCPLCFEARYDPRHLYPLFEFQLTGIYYLYRSFEFINKMTETQVPPHLAERQKNLNIN